MLNLFLKINLTYLVKKLIPLTKIIIIVTILINIQYYKN
jgi:hypothetical protein